MKFEIYEIPDIMEYMGNDYKMQLMKMLLNKLHTYQDFCANEEVTIHIGEKDYTFKLVKRRYLNINDEDSRYVPLYKLEYLAKNCPETDFVSKYNIELRDFILHNYLDTGKVVRIVDNDFYTYIIDDVWKEESYNIDKSYIILSSVSIQHNRVIINYKQINIYGDNWDDMQYKEVGMHTAVITKSWMKSENCLDFITMDDFFNYVNNCAKEAIFNFSMDVNKVLNNFKEKLGIN